MTPRVLCLLAIACLGTSVQAGPLKPRQVDPDSSWLAHLDIERFAESTLGRFARAHPEAFHVNVKEAEDELGIELFRDIYGVTLFGGDGGPEEDATAVLEMSTAIDGIIERMKAEPGYETLDRDGYTVHRWAEDDPSYGIVLRGDSRDRRLVILSSSADRVVRTAKVVDGKRRSLFDALDDVNGFIAASSLPQPGSIAFALARGLPWVPPGEDAASFIARKSDRVRFELREADRTTTAEVVIAVRKREDAESISAVLQGLVALGRLVGTNEPDLAGLEKLAASVSIAAEASDVCVRLRVESDDLRRHLEHMLLEHD